RVRHRGRRCHPAAPVSAMRIHLIVVAVLAFPVAARAAGLEVLEQSPDAVGMAGAQAANAYSPAAAFYNPAAMAFQRGLTMQPGVNTLIIRGNVTPEGGTATPN